MIFPIIIYSVTAVGMLWAIINAYSVLSIKVEGAQGKDYLHLENERDSDKIRMMVDIGGKISRGADTFLFQEYLIMCVFIVFFGGLVFGVVDILGNESGGVSAYCTYAYVVGSVTSMLCGWIGMKIAVVSNFRTTFKAM